MGPSWPALRPGLNPGSATCWGPCQPWCAPREAWDRWPLRGLLPSLTKPSYTRSVNGGVAMSYRSQQSPLKHSFPRCQRPTSAPPNRGRGRAATGLGQAPSPVTSHPLRNQRPTLPANAQLSPNVPQAQDLQSRALTMLLVRRQVSRHPRNKTPLATPGLP